MKKISPNKDTEYYVIQKNSKVFIIPNEQTDSVSINDKDGSINEEHHITDYVEKDVPFSKYHISEIVKIKDKTYTVFQHKIYRIIPFSENKNGVKINSHLFTETSNVKEFSTLEGFEKYKSETNTIGELKWY